MKSIVNYITEAKNESSDKLYILIDKLSSIYYSVQNEHKFKLNLKCRNFEPGNIVMYVWKKPNEQYEYTLYRFDKYNTYTTWSYGSKVKETGYALKAKCTEIRESKGMFIARGAQDMEKIYNEKRHVIAYFPVALNIEELNNGNIVDEKKLVALSEGKSISDLMLADRKDIKEFDIKNIDNKFFTKDKFKSSYQDVSDHFFKPGNIILTINDEKDKICISEFVKFNKGKVPGMRISTYGNLDYATTNIIYPNYSKTKPESLPNWYDEKIVYSYSSNKSYNRYNNFVIAESFTDFINGKLLTFEDNENRLNSAKSDYDNTVNANSAKKKEYLEKMKEITKPYTTVKERQKEIYNKTFETLMNSYPKSYNDVLKAWEKAIQKMEDEQVTGNKTEYQGKIINTSGGYYATSEKNGEIEQLGAPCVPTNKTNILNMHKMLVEAFNKWKNDNYPKISKEQAYFLSPVVVIIGNNGNVGVTSAGVIVPAAENWHISTNNGKSNSGLLKINTEKVMLAGNMLYWPKNLYTFK